MKRTLSRWVAFSAQMSGLLRQQMRSAKSEVRLVVMRLEIFARPFGLSRMILGFASSHIILRLMRSFLWRVITLFCALAAHQLGNFLNHIRMLGRQVGSFADVFRKVVE